MLLSQKRTRLKSRRREEGDKNSTKEAITVSKVELVRNMGKLNSKGKRRVPFKDTIRRCPILKELQKKKYPFPDLDLLGMLDDLLEKRVI